MHLVGFSSLAMWVSVIVFARQKVTFFYGPHS